MAPDFFCSQDSSADVAMACCLRLAKSVCDSAVLKTIRPQAGFPASWREAQLQQPGMSTLLLVHVAVFRALALRRVCLAPVCDCDRLQLVKACKRGPALNRLSLQWALPLSEGPERYLCVRAADKPWHHPGPARSAVRLLTPRVHQPSHYDSQVANKQPGTGRTTDGVHVAVSHGLHSMVFYVL